MLVHIRSILIITALWAQIVQPNPFTSDTSNHTLSNNSTGTVTHGWTSSPDGRGTIDIVWSCLVTTFLCSWSVLCLHIPSQKDTRFHILWRKFWLTALCGLGPEFIFQLALGQWSSARQSVRDFHASEFSEWTMKHAFFADSGGFFLNTPDFKPIPIDAKQLLYLINHKYIEYPAFTEQDIDDKNKVDILLRLISMLQIIWFIVDMIARGVQGLVITGTELTTAAFILCSFGTTFCWWDKGADISVPVTLNTETTMVEILQTGGDAAAKPYHRTPLDFVSRAEWHWSLYWTHWINILRRMHISFAPKALPHDRIENTIWPDISARGSLPAFMLMTAAYSAIFIAGWNDHFPSTQERWLWRISSLSMLFTITLYFVITGFAYIAYPALKRCLKVRAAQTSEHQTSHISQQSLSKTESGATPEQPGFMPQHQKNPPNSSKARLKLESMAETVRNNTILKDPSLNVPLKAQLPMYVVAFIYCLARTLILLLDMIQLRSLPLSAYQTVNWGSFFPHLS